VEFRAFFLNRAGQVSTLKPDFGPGWVRASKQSFRVRPDLKFQPLVSTPVKRNAKGKGYSIDEELEVHL
uniref:Uncharacterized protein n=1 Tax=Romanomermis culicivorax TaxID=13658 RepID=A0A915L2B4_ROMCU